MTWTTRQANCWNTSLFHLSHAEVAKRLLSMCHNGTLMVQQGHQQHGALNYPWLGSLSIFLLEQVAWLLDGVGPFLPAFMAPLLAFGSPKVDPMAAAWSSAPNGPRPWMAVHHVAKVHWLFLVQLAFHAHFCWFLGLHKFLLLVILLGGCSAILQALVPHGLLAAAGSRLVASKLGKL